MVDPEMQEELRQIGIATNLDMNLQDSLVIVEIGVLGLLGPGYLDMMMPTTPDQ